MKLKTFASIFTGGGGADLGLMDAGLGHLWGIEYEKKIAAVANDNIGGVICTSVLDVDPSTLDKPDWLHMSPPCPNFSVAKSGGEESDNDLKLARKCAEFVTTLRPKVVSLENVRAYEKSESWLIIYKAMIDNGYTVQWSIINMADFGVPQRRVRMIAVGILGKYGLFMPLPATHCKGGLGGLFGLKPWNSWDEAIKDLVPDFKNCELAPWQIKRVEKDKDLQLLLTGNTSHSGSGGNGGVIVQSAHSQSNGSPFKGAGNPSSTIDTSAAMKLIQSDNTSSFSIKAIKLEGDISMCLTASSGEKGTEPRIVKGAVVSRLSPRAFARLQSFPDSYRLPPQKTTAIRIIGNAVPPLFMKKLAHHIIGVIN